MKDFIQTKAFTHIIQAIVIITIGLIIFSVGMEFGRSRVPFPGIWNNDNDRSFMGPRFMSSMMGGIGNDEILRSHGAFGDIVTLRPPMIVIRDPNNVEKSAVIDDQTILRQMHGIATTTDLKIGETVIVIGNPDDAGVIHASLIRIMPPHPVSLPSSFVSPSTKR